MAVHTTPILIVGAGIGGLMLAILLQKAGLDYEIIERSKDSIKHLGASIAIGANSFAVLEQLGVYEQLVSISVPFEYAQFYDQKMTPIGVLDYKMYKERCGYNVRVFARHELYQVLIKLIPENKIRMGKNVVMVSDIQDQEYTKVVTEDGDVFLTKVVVGADGVRSKIRQEMHKVLKKENLLTKKDASPAPYATVGMVGLSEPLDPKVWKGVDDKICRFEVWNIDKPESSAFVITTNDNRVCWQINVTADLGSVQAVHEFSRQSSGPKALDDVLHEIRDIPLSFGGPTFGELMDATTDKHQSRIVLEEIVYDKWYHGRLVLLGDSVHKIHSATGQGANMAVMDSVILANILNSLGPDKLDLAHLTKGFEFYQDERRDKMNVVNDSSIQYAKVCHGHGWLWGWVRWLFLNYRPDFVARYAFDLFSRPRPLATFLPPVKDHGPIPALERRDFEEWLKKEYPIRK